MDKKPPRRKKAPWKPGDPVPPMVDRQFGFPPPAPMEDLSKPKRILPRRNLALFTMPDEREAIVAFALADLAAKGIVDPCREDIQISGTSVDKNLNRAEYEALCWFLDVHTALQANISAASAHEAEYTHTAQQLPEAFLEFLDWVGRCQYPKRFREQDSPPTKLQMARRMFVPTDEKYLRGGADGYLQAIAQEIAHIRAERETLMRRLELIRGEYASRRENSQVRKKRA